MSNSRRLLYYCRRIITILFLSFIELSHINRESLSGSYIPGNVTETERNQLDSLEVVKEKAAQAVLTEERNQRKARAEVSYS